MILGFVFRGILSWFAALFLGLTGCHSTTELIMVWFAAWILLSIEHIDYEIQDLKKKKVLKK